MRGIRVPVLQSEPTSVRNHRKKARHWRTKSVAKVTISALGLEIPAVGGSLEKYFKNVMKLRPAADDLVALREDLDRSLENVESDQIRIGFAVEEDVDVGGDDTEWTIGGESSAGLQVWNTAEEIVLAGNDFGEQSTLKVPAGQAYVGIDFEGSLSTGVEHERGDVTFGFNGEGGVNTANYRPLPASTTLEDALSETMSGFVLPGDLNDIEALPPGAVATVSGSGSLKFAVKGEVGTSATVLSTTIPKTDKTVAVNTGVSVGLGASAEFTGGYELRLHRLSDGKVTLGYFKKDAKEVLLSVSVSAGASVAAGGKDVTEKILEAVSGEPKVDRDFLLTAGLDEEKIKELEEVVVGGVDRSLKASLELGWGRLNSHEAAFLFTIDVPALDDAGKQAIHSALDGDLLDLTSTEFSGVELTRSVVRETLEKSSTLRLNLFGLFNYSSIFELAQKGEAVYDDRTGELQFLDEATAKKMQASINNTRAVPTEKVARLVMETILISHLYNAITSTRTLDVVHQYFEFHSKTKRHDMKDHFDVPVALGLLGREDAGSAAAKQGPGRSALRAETRYSPEESRRLFIHIDDPDRARGEYEKAGRRALVLLESGDEEDDARRLLGKHDEVFDALRDAGSWSNAQHVLARVQYDGNSISENLHGAIYSDYVAIRWWSRAMVTLGQALAAVNSYESNYTGDPESLRNDDEYQRLRERLRKASAKVAEETDSRFGDPWGLVAMDLIGRPKIVNVQITTDTGVYHYERTAVPANV